MVTIIDKNMMLDMISLFVITFLYIFDIETVS